MDILARHRPTGALLVFELKRNLAGLEVLDQLRGYVLGAAQAHDDGQAVWGAILAREHSAELRAAAKESGIPIRLLAFSGTPKEILIYETLST